MVETAGFGAGSMLAADELLLWASPIFADELLLADWTFRGSACQPKFRPGLRVSSSPSTGLDAIKMEIADQELFQPVRAQVPYVVLFALRK